MFVFESAKLMHVEFRSHGDPATVEAALNQTLSDLGLDYLDLYLMHWPVSSSPSSHLDYISVTSPPSMFAIPLTNPSPPDLEVTASAPEKQSPPPGSLQFLPKTTRIPHQRNRRQAVRTPDGTPSLPPAKLVVGFAPRARNFSHCLFAVREREPDLRS